eukprot:9764107-Alexandrium_andersonii.AAC.1
MAPVRRLPHGLGCGVGGAAGAGPAVGPAGVRSGGGWSCPVRNSVLRCSHRGWSKTAATMASWRP